MQNIEIKTIVTDAAGLRARIENLGAIAEWTRHQRDVFFHVDQGYLKLRTVKGHAGELIAYQRAQGTEPRPSDYDIAVVPQAEILEQVLTRSLGVRGVVEKERTLYLWQHTRIHLDKVRGLGLFLELEAVARDISLAEARAEADHVIAALDLNTTDFLDRPYLELLETGATP